MSGLMVVSFWIGLLVFLLPVLGSFLFLLGIAGVAVSGGMLMIFVLMVFDVLVGVSALFLDLYSPFNALRCGGVILALQSSSAVHLGVDNLGVVRHVGRLLVDCPVTTPFELVNDGDLLFLIDRMLHLCGRYTVRIRGCRLWS